eukprot:scaffold399348_cov31-Prasinocladus_malaysianus.AAC.1
MACFCDVEKKFMTWPWKVEQKKILEDPHTDIRELQIYCPFTFEQATHRCNVCGTCVTEDAFHTADVKILSKLPVGGDIVSWDLAAEAVISTSTISASLALSGVLSALMGLAMAVAFADQHSLYFRDNCMKIPKFLKPVFKWYASGTQEHHTNCVQ